MIGRKSLSVWHKRKRRRGRYWLWRLASYLQQWRFMVVFIGAYLLLLTGAGSGTSVAMAQGDSAGDTTAPAQSESTAVTAEGVQTRRVKVNFFVNSIHDIDEVNGRYVVDFWFDLFWRDPALEGKTVDEVDTALLWNPQIQALNAVDLTVLYESYADSFEPDTNVYLSQRLLGTFSSPFDLSRFPFDTQQLEIQIESEEFDSNRLLFDFMGADQAIIYSERPFTFPIPINKYISSEFTLRSWSLTAADVTQQIHVLPYDKSTWSQFRIGMQLERQSLPYVLKIMLVFGLIMVLGVAVFALPLNELRYRLLTLFTLLLTAVTFDFTRLQSTPRASYLTLLDQQALLCYFTIAAAIGAAVIIAVRNNQGASTQAQQLNRWLAAGYFLLVVIINLGLGWYATGS